MLCQEAIDTKQNECAAILVLLRRPTVKGALGTIDAIVTNPAIAQAITDMPPSGAAPVQYSSTSMMVSTRLVTTGLAGSGERSRRDRS